MIHFETSVVIWQEVLVSGQQIDKRYVFKGEFLQVSFYNAVSSPLDGSDQLTLHFLLDLFNQNHLKFSRKHLTMPQLLQYYSNTNIRNGL